jgi:hypothetical protein
LRSEEYDLLEKVFGLPEENDKIYYKSLVEEVETVFTIKVNFFDLLLILF